MAKTIRCPHMNSIGYFDDKSTDLCMLSEKPSGRIHPCLLVSGDVCEIWEEIKSDSEDDGYAEVLAEDYGSGGNSEE